MIFLGAACITIVIQLAGFAVSSALQTEVFYDVLGGLNFIALAAFATIGNDSRQPTPRNQAITATFVISRAWLLIFLAWRAHERGGDSRFDHVLRPKSGAGINYGLFLVFWVAQGCWVYFISSPMIYINGSPSATSPQTITSSTWDIVFFTGFAFGVLIEVVADVQKTIWIRAGRKGGFCTVGVWNFSRSPNYFGEMCQFWCCWLLAYSSSPTGISDPIWWATSISPLFTCHILLNMPATGLAQANGKSLKRYYESPHADAYRKYRESTSILLPMVGYRYVPKWLKRSICLDFKKYEYRPKAKSLKNPKKAD